VVFSDCQYVLKKAEKLRTCASTLRQLGVSLQLRWLPGHAGVAGNIVADRVVSEAVKTSNCNMITEEGFALLDLAIEQVGNMRSRNKQKHPSDFEWTLKG
jgi:hypothetical protein